MAFTFENGEWNLKSGGQVWHLERLAKERPRPFYLYDLDSVSERARAFAKAPGQVHYAMKANAHPRLLSVLRQAGFGVDVVSLGEMQKALACGFSPQRVIFSGVGKDTEDLKAALAHRIFQINAESFEELQALAVLTASTGQTADVAIRLNIHLTAPTHKNIQTATEESKFGLDLRLLPEVLSWLKTQPQLRLKALAVHIGSQILDVSVFETMSRKMGELFRDVKAQSFPLERLDLGGGLGIDYQNDGAEDFPRLQRYFKALSAHDSPAQLLLEPGRFLVARSGVLIAKVVYVKRGVSRQFAILNAGMTSLMRPALYDAYHRIEPLRVRGGERETYSVVGPICESTDVFAEAREMPRLAAGDHVAIFEAGAYGAVMANTYNESPLPEQWSVLDGRMEVL
ncbi:MAG: diaminopimelate decarboxylase [Bdellovibrionales bacterium]|nr:diaminopimelate decarboxylase [Bdellovibrionales bacterium]